ncbi:MAG: response regulator [Sulfuritalea sp.]|nr:response regulator [Sulfuritalea sp.]
MIKKILLVEDDLPKLTQIADAVAASDIELTIAKSINEAIRRLDESAFDCILLDMSLPTFNEGPNVSSSGRQQDFGGRQILTYMWELEIKSRVMLVTQLPGFKNEGGKEVKLKELDAALARDFPGLYMGFTYFHHSTDAWAKRLREFLENV